MTLVAGAFVIIGAILVGTASTFAQAVAGEAVAGIGGGICELTALAG